MQGSKQSPSWGVFWLARNSTGTLNAEIRRDFMILVETSFRVFVVPDVKPSDLNPPCRDPRDNIFLALALASDADLIISSDEDLLILHPWRGIPILTPAKFLAK